MKVWLQGNSVTISVSGVEIDGQAVTDAIVRATLEDMDGGPVAGEAWPVSLNYDDGEYRATVSPDVEVDLYTKYRLVIDIDRAGTVGKRVCSVWVTEGCK